jgi:hypothetical protein
MYHHILTTKAGCASLAEVYPIPATLLTPAIEIRSRKRRMRCGCGGGLAHIFSFSVVCRHACVAGEEDSARTTVTKWSRALLHPAKDVREATWVQQVAAGPLTRRARGCHYQP